MDAVASTPKKEEEEFLIYCQSKCRDYTLSNPGSLIVYKKKDYYYVGAICTICSSKKSRRLGKSDKFDALLSADKARLPLVLRQYIPTDPGNKKEVQKKSMQKGSGISEVKEAAVKEASSSEYPSDNEEEMDAVVLTAALSGDAENEGAGIFDKAKHFFKKESAPRKFVKGLVSGIPVVGDLLVDTGLVDVGLDKLGDAWDWAKANIWQPVKGVPWLRSF